MDTLTLRQRGLEIIKKYRYVVLVILAGVALMCLPSEKETAAAPETVRPQPELQEELETLLSRLEGAGKVKVLLTQATGAKTIYQTDETIRDDTRQSDTVLVTGTDRSQTGLVQQVDPPRYQGAVVLCQGAQRASVRLAIVEAVANATGLPSNKISVLKMK